MARKLGVAAPSVTQWTRGIRKVPPSHALRIETLTGRRVTRHQLRPDKDAFWRLLEEAA